jgi:hypothetical protein
MLRRGALAVARGGVFDLPFPRKGSSLGRYPISDSQAHIHNTAPVALRTKNPTREGWMRALCHGRFIS